MSGAEKIVDIAHRYAEKYGWVVLPTRNKMPIGPWKHVKKSLPRGNKNWGAATGYCILTEPSKLTVIDIDDPEWFHEFEKNVDLKETAKVRTPSGGYHFYYKQTPLIKSQTNLGGTKKVGGDNVGIDTRSKGGIIVGPESPYDTNKPEKKKYIGNPYEVLVGFDKLIDIDPVWLHMAKYGADRKNFKLRDPKPEVEEKIDPTEKALTWGGQKINPHDSAGKEDPRETGSALQSNDGI